MKIQIACSIKDNRDLSYHHQTQVACSVEDNRDLFYHHHNAMTTQVACSVEDNRILFLNQQSSTRLTIPSRHNSKDGEANKD